jgi:O-antigen/teichoic acid export membrane protein|tara:strand:+ start:517 stop:2079 length:1563 start_codon:yes stop_codon:yes gene_type:complete
VNFDLEDADTTVAKGATSIYFSNIVILGMNTVYFIIIANLFSTAEIGIYAGIQLIIFGSSTLTNLSLPQIIPTNIMIPHAVTKLIPEFLGRNEKGKATRSFFIILLISLSIATILTFLIYILAEPISQTLFRGEAEVLWIHLLALDTWIFSMGQVFYGGLVGLKRAPRASLFLVISFAVKYILGASLVIAGQGLLGIIIAFVIGDMVFLVLASTSCLGPLWVSHKPVPTKFIMNYSLPLLITSLIIFGVTQLDKIFTFMQLELSDLGIYNIAVTASTIGAFAPNAITTALVPSLSTLEATKKIEEFKKLAKSYTRYVALIATPMSFGVAALASGLVQLFGQQYLPGALPTTIMSVAIGLTAISAVYNGELLATGRSRSIMFVNLAGLVILGIGLAILAPLLDFVGVALSRSIMTVSIAIFLAYVTHKRGLFVIDGKAYRDAVFAASVMGIILFLVLDFISGYRSQLISLAFLIPAGMVIYLVILRILKTFQPDDIEFIRKFLPKRADRLVQIIYKIVAIK